MKLLGAAPQLEQYMDLLSVRQKLVASNVANAATPGYQTKDFDFQYEFEKAVADGGAPRKPLDMVPVPGLKARNDGNNVNLDRESRLLAENAMRFNVATNLWKQQAKLARMALAEAKNG